MKHGGCHKDGPHARFMNIDNNKNALFYSEFFSFSVVYKEHVVKETSLN